MKKRTAIESSSQVSSPLLWSARQFVFHCGLSVRSVWRAKSTGLLLLTVKVNLSIRWRAYHIIDLVSISFPNQKEFLARMEAHNAK